MSGLGGGLSEEQADQEIGNRLKSEIKRLLLSDQFQRSASVDQMTELLMQRLADIAEEEDQRVNLYGEEEEGDDDEIDGEVVLV
jgi:hypothetical protein